jgi:hypothetical protein
MADNRSQAVEAPEEPAEPDFDNLVGIVTDGVIGAVGGAVGTAAMTVGLLIAASLDAFDFVAFAELSDLTGLGFLLPGNPTAIGYVIFLLGGMITFPLLFASIGSYLPGRKFAIKGLPFGFVLWTGFVGAFYADQTGLALALYAVITLVAHLFYGFTLGAVFDYFSNRPSTLV